ncbi:MAG: hypothetical protein WBZ51_16915, partial [Xanthobacteraceae bacterium]
GQRLARQQPTPREIMMTPADVCDAIAYCNTIPWGEVGAVVAALALTYGIAMSIALVVYVYRFRGQRIMRR